MKVVKLEDVIDLLKDYADLKDNKEIASIKPTHGSCCTCQVCGYYHDDCVCISNEIVRGLRVITFDVAETEQETATTEGESRHEG